MWWEIGTSLVWFFREWIVWIIAIGLIVLGRLGEGRDLLAYWRVDVQVKPSRRFVRVCSYVLVGIAAFWAFHSMRLAKDEKISDLTERAREIPELRSKLETANTTIDTMQHDFEKWKQEQQRIELRVDQSEPPGNRYVRAYEIEGGTLMEFGVKSVALVGPPHVGVHLGTGSYEDVEYWFSSPLCPVPSKCARRVPPLAHRRSNQERHHFQVSPTQETISPVQSFYLLIRHQPEYSIVECYMRPAAEVGEKPVCSSDEIDFLDLTQ